MQRPCCVNFAFLADRDNYFVVVADVLLGHFVSLCVVCFDEFNYPDSGKHVKRNNDFLRKLFLSCYKIIQ